MKAFYRKAIALCLSMVVMFMIVGTAAAEGNVNPEEKNFSPLKENVSPVIGVILQVAITVILAAAIGSSVFGQGSLGP